MKDFKDYCKDYIVDHIDEFVGQIFYGSDFAYHITQEPNTNGTLTFSRQEAKDYLKEWWDDAAEYWDYEKDNFGENTHNPFDNPDDEFELTQEQAEDIKYYVTDFDGDIF